MAAGATDCLDRAQMLCGRIGTGRVFTQQIGIAQNRRERRADFVAHVRQELALAPVRCLRVTLRLTQRFLALDLGRHVHDRAEQADDQSVGITPHATLSADNAHTVRTARRAEHQRVRLAATHRALHRFREACGIVRREVRQHPLETRRAIGLVPTIQPVHLARPLNRARTQIERPAPESRDGLRFFQQVRRALQLQLGLFLRRDIETDRDVLLDGAIRTDIRHDGTIDPIERAVRVAIADLPAPRMPRRDRRPHIRPELARVDA